MDGRSGRQARPMDSLSALWVGRDKSPTVCAIGQMRVWSLAPTGKPYKRVLRAPARGGEVQSAALCCGAAMTSPVSELVELLSLERLEHNLFRGQSRDIGTRFVFGGQVLGQALSAAQATLAGPRPAHSLHAFFLRAGDVDHPIVYEVDRT